MPAAVPSSGRDPSSRAVAWLLLLLVVEGLLIVLLLLLLLLALRIAAVVWRCWEFWSAICQVHIAVVLLLQLAVLLLFLPLLLLLGLRWALLLPAVLHRGHNSQLQLLW